MLLLNFQISYDSLVQLWLNSVHFSCFLCWKSFLHRHMNITYLTHENHAVCGNITTLDYD